MARPSKITMRRSFKRTSAYVYQDSLPKAVNQFLERKTYVPLRIVRKYWAHAEEYHGKNNVNISDFLVGLEITPWAEEYDAAVLFADISGFSRLAEDLNRELLCSVNAAEDLSLYIEACMAQMVRVITDCGGDIIKFAGDACLAVFDAHSFQGSLPNATVQACSAALRVTKLNLRAGNIRLKVHCGIGAGKICGFQVGGIKSRFEYIVTGAPVTEMSHATDEAEAGQVVISSKAYGHLLDAIPKQLRTRSSGSLRLAKGSAKHENTGVKYRYHNDQVGKGSFSMKRAQSWSRKSSHERRNSLMPVEASPMLSGRYELTKICMLQSKSDSFLFDGKKGVECREDICQTLLPVLNAYIPTPALTAIKSQGSGRIARFQVCTTIFIKIIGLQYDQGILYLNKVQTMFNGVQAVIQKYEGTVCRYTVDDKGSYILAAFGLLASCRRDNAGRAVLAAMEIQQKLVTKHSLGCQIGLTTGKVFCGTVGGSIRNEYTMHGSVVNLAARLMSKVISGIFVCSHTRNRTYERIIYGKAKAILVKGFDRPIPVFSPIKEKNEIEKSVDENSHNVLAPHESTVPLIGRDIILTFLDKLVHEFSYSIAGGIVVIKGDHGLGKTRLCKYIASSAEPYEIESFIYSGQHVHTSTKYEPWRQLIFQIMFDARYEVDNHDDCFMVEMENRLNFLNELEMATVNSLFPRLFSKMKHNDSQSLVGLAQATYIGTMLVSIMEHFMNMNTNHPKKRLLLILDDAHLIHETAMEIVRCITNKTPTCMAIMTQLIDNDAETSVEPSLPDNVSVIVLPPLEEHFVVEISKHILKARFIESRLMREIVIQGQCNPLFTLEVLRMMKEQNRLVVSGDFRARLTSNTHSGSEDHVPDVMAALVAEKIGKIEDETIRSQAERVLQVASVFGTEFSETNLFEMNPLGIRDGEQKELKISLRALEELRLIKIAYMKSCAGSPPEKMYQFSQSYVQAAAYSSLLYEERKQIHSDVALVLEKDAGQRTASLRVTKQLALHFFKGYNVKKAIHYLEEAGYRSRIEQEYEAVKVCYTRLLQICGHCFASKSFQHEALIGRSREKGITTVNHTKDLRVKSWMYANWCMYLADVYVLEDNDEMALPYYEEALAVLGANMRPTVYTLFPGKKLLGFRSRTSPTISKSAIKIISRCYLALARLKVSFSDSYFMYSSALSFAKQVRSSKETSSLICTCYVDFSWFLFCSGDPNHIKVALNMFSKAITVLSEIQEEYSLIYLHYRFSELLFSSGDFETGKKYFKNARELCSRHKYHRLNLSISLLEYNASVFGCQHETVKAALRSCSQIDDQKSFFLRVLFTMATGSFDLVTRMLWNNLNPGINIINVVDEGGAKGYRQSSKRGLHSSRGNLRELERKIKVSDSSMSTVSQSCIRVSTSTLRHEWTSSSTKCNPVMLRGIVQKYLKLTDNNTAPLEARVALGVYSALNGWYSETLYACTLVFDFILQKPNTLGPFHWYEPLVQMTSIYFAMIACSVPNSVYHKPILKQIKSITKLLRQFKDISTLFNTLWLISDGWKKYSERETKHAIKLWKKSFALAEEIKYAIGIQRIGKILDIVDNKFNNDHDGNHDMSVQSIFNNIYCCPDDDLC